MVHKLNIHIAVKNEPQVTGNMTEAEMPKSSYGSVWLNSMKY